MLELQVDLGQRSYPIYIGEGLLSDAASYLEGRNISKKSSLLIVTDEQVAASGHLGLVENSLREAGYRLVSHIVPSGEKSKSLSIFEEIITTALEGGLDRNSSVIALGGGVVGDLAGFVAATFMRGVKFIQMPTTILAHDSSVGGKVAVNHRIAKNIIGAFHQPELVLYDVATLRTLSPREIRSGYAEMVKHGLIWDAQFVTWLDEHADKLLALDTESLQYGLHKGCQVKSYVVSQDERENDLRAILNLGHTIGHALEAVAGYGELLHGEAISIGMVGAAKLAQRLGFSKEIEQVTRALLAKFELPTQLPDHFNSDLLMEAMAHDKKFKEGKMVFVIPTEIGKVEVNRNVSSEWVREVIEQLKEEQA
ncbi:3-dehydroquinate synthase [Paenibacillus sp. N1-5-1-14]|uniref:3-dehydroquinate synthase n=1 Tax=Paenibacillus radicibacter TaxID=2972488 RepID=UPI0021593AEF|nr:3-dehydroquinate synthase [Paenibacillus radicibacter]MCR8642286.1 3-dehydroquinate synthase [Paenibacillus radicibacter]